MEERFVYITCKDLDEARKVGRTIVGARLAACANILNPMNSIYWWKGELVEDQETILILKTMAAQVEPLIEKVKSIHSYEVPCVVALPIVKGNPDYLEWIRQEVENP